MIIFHRIPTTSELLLHHHYYCCMACTYCQQYCHTSAHSTAVPHCYMCTYRRECTTATKKLSLPCVTALPRSGYGLTLVTRLVAGTGALYIRPEGSRTMRFDKHFEISKSNLASISRTNVCRRFSCFQNDHASTKSCYVCDHTTVRHYLQYQPKLFRVEFVLGMPALERVSSVF